MTRSCSGNVPILYLIYTYLEFRWKTTWIDLRSISKYTYFVPNFTYLRLKWKTTLIDLRSIPKYTYFVLVCFPVLTCDLQLIIPSYTYFRLQFSQLSSHTMHALSLFSFAVFNSASQPTFICTHLLFLMSTMGYVSTWVIKTFQNYNKKREFRSTILVVKFNCLVSLVILCTYRYVYLSWN